MKWKNEEKLKFVQDTLKANPALCSNHFSRKCGIGKITLDKWEAEGLIKFGDSLAYRDKMRKFHI